MLIQETQRGGLSSRRNGSKTKRHTQFRRDGTRRGEKRAAAGPGFQPRAEMTSTGCISKEPTGSAAWTLTGCSPLPPSLPAIHSPPSGQHGPPLLRSPLPCRVTTKATPALCVPWSRCPWLILPKPHSAPSHPQGLCPAVPAAGSLPPTWSRLPSSLRQASPQKAPRQKGPRRQQATEPLRPRPSAVLYGCIFLLRTEPPLIDLFILWSRKFSIKTLAPCCLLSP